LQAHVKSQNADRESGCEKEPECQKEPECEKDPECEKSQNVKKIRMGSANRIFSLDGNSRW